MVNILIIDINSNINGNNISNIEKYIDSNNLQELYYWNYLKYKYKAFIKINKKNLDINKHKLPPFGISSITDQLSNIEQIYSDIYILKEHDKKYIDLSIEEYCEFYSIISINYSDSGSDSGRGSGSECECNIDGNYLLEIEETDKKIICDKEIKNTNNEELDTDINTYVEYITT
tara:strand:+ start:261 stop:782 length:522 start_codon:yes stop_codon:yes gene_type:complete